MGNILPVNVLMFFEIEIKPTRYDVTLNQGLRMRIFSWECLVVFTKVFDGYGISYLCLIS